MQITEQKWFLSLVNMFRPDLKKFSRLDEVDNSMMRNELYDTNGLNEFSFYFTEFRLTGDKEELDRLYNQIKGMEFPWINYLVKSLCGYAPIGIKTYGRFDAISREEDYIRLVVESRDSPLIEAIEFIASQFKTISVYYLVQDSFTEKYIKRSNPEKGWFTENLYLYLSAYPVYKGPERMYFNSEEEIATFLSNTFGRTISNTEDICTLKKQIGWKRCRIEIYKLAEA